MTDLSGIRRMLAGCESSLAKTKEVHTHLTFPLATPHSNQAMLTRRQACRHHIWEVLPS